MILESDELDAELVQLLALRYVVVVWAKDGKVFYQLTSKAGATNRTQKI